MENIVCIYKIENNINNKVYIGQTVDYKRRKEEHLLRYNNNTLKSNRSYLYRAFRKYGIENFTFSILEECKICFLNEKERYYITQYDSFINGYNMTLGGQNDAPNRKLNLEDIIFVRKLYDSQTIYSNKEIWEEYFKDKITLQYFRNLWQGTNWKEVMPEVFTEENKKYYTHKNKGAKKGAYSDEEVLFYRTEYINIAPKELYKLYDVKNTAFRGFEAMLRNQTYSHLPSVEQLRKVLESREALEEKNE